MEKKYSSTGVIKFILLSLIGIFLFLVPVSGTKVPIVIIIGTVLGFFGANLKYVVLAVLTILMITLFLGKVLKIEPFAKLHKADSLQKVIFFILAWIAVMSFIFHIGPEALFTPGAKTGKSIAEQVLGLAGFVMLTVSVAGWLIVFMLKSGIVEFLGTLMEPLMKPIFRLPGQSAVNCISAFMVSPAVGVLMADEYYKEGHYNRRQAIAAMTNFSTVSVGYIAVLSGFGGLTDYYGQMIVITLVLVFIMTAITVRIPPLARYSQEYMVEKKDGESEYRSRIEKALTLAAKKSEEFTLKVFFKSLVNACVIAQKIIANMIPIVIVALSLVNFTPVFDWLGKPLVPVLSLLQLPNADVIAPTALLGFIEVSLPSMSIAGQGVALKSAFFVVMLSMIQIVFMTEAGNAMLGSKVKLKITDLFLIFVIRTVIAIPIVALVAHLFF